ncbi:MAG: hypothetical protein CMH55_01675 [Myxococcales bacterium]|nr:hypothetical protein [Myxococcales bacterium]
MMRASLPILILLASACSNCTEQKPVPVVVPPAADAGGGSSPGDGGPICVDADGDGYGQDCAAGPDCNDADPDQQTHCDRCQSDQPEAGCACDVGTPPMSCYDGPPGTQGVGICRAGTITCEDGIWSRCRGVQNPREYEFCNDRDDNCDGQVDEGVRSECGNCDPNCHVADPPTPDGSLPEPDEERDSGVGINDDGHVVLDRREVDLNFLWIANAGEGTVSKVDTTLLREVGRYHSIGPNDHGLSAGGHNSPSRTGIDLNGDMVVANRAFGGQGSATKIANVDCEDRNGNGSIETSNDSNGNGIIDRGDPTEFPGGADECFSWTVPVGGGGGTPRALTIDSGDEENPMGNVWVGNYSEQRFYGLEGSDGDLLARPGLTNPVPIGHRPYGAAIDSEGYVWSGTLSGGSIAGFDSRSGNRVLLASPRGVPAASYGFGIDGSNRLWVGAQSSGVNRYDPYHDSNGNEIDPLSGNGVWRHAPCPVSCYMRGLGADTEGRVWVANNQGGVIGWNADTMALVGNFPVNSSPITGAGPDFFGYVWGVSGAGETIRIDVDNGGGITRVPVGSGPYTYSDFTGYGLRNFTAPRGDYSTIVSGCTGGPTTWDELLIDADVPPNSRIDARIRVADEEDQLEAPGNPQYGPYTATSDGGGRTHDLAEVPDGRFLLLSFRLISNDRDATPVLRDFDLRFHCERGQ